MMEETFRLYRNLYSN